MPLHQWWFRKQHGSYLERSTSLLHVPGCALSQLLLALVQMAVCPDDQELVPEQVHAALSL